MKVFKANIAVKLTVPSIAGIVVVLLLFFLVMVRYAETVQERQLEHAIDALKREKEKQDTLLRENINNYKKLLGEMLVLVAPEKIMTLDYEALDQLATMATNDPNIAYIVFRDAEGNLLTTHEKVKLDDGFTFVRDIELWGEKIGVVEVGITTRRLQNAIDEIEEATASLIASAREEKAKSTGALIRKSILFTAVTCIFSALIIFFSTRLITRPLSLLLDGIQRIRHDDFMQPLEVKSTDEIGQVAKIFDLMRLKLLRTITELREHKVHLEDKVVHRTTELQQKNEELNRANEELKNALATLKETQEELLRAEKFAVVGQMAGIVAHEVLNPVTAISLRVEANITRSDSSLQVIDRLGALLRETESRLFMPCECDASTAVVDKLKKDMAMLRKVARAMEENQKSRHEDFLFLEKHANRVLKIIDGLRQMSKSATSMDAVRVDGLLDEVIEDMADSLGKRHIKVLREFGVRPVMHADHMELYSIVSNLIRNAMQAIERRRDDTGLGGTITLRLYQNDGDMIAVEVSDTGVGVPRDKWENIFEPDFTSKGREGTGLGLSYARKLARSYMGDLVVKESEQGKGSTFLVTLHGDSRQSISNEA